MNLFRVESSNQKRVEEKTKSKQKVMYVDLKAIKSRETATEKSSNQFKVRLIN